MRAVEANIHGCDLTVTARGDTYVWLVVQDGQHVADGAAATLQAAQTEAEAAARRHAAEEAQPKQMTLF